ncbi:MAG: YihY/virulence factor BrkB family protein [Chloroflexi bacterium]|nr:YihY/virulence factor BrkB family protein [Chloroflexota bacterium]
MKEIFQLLKASYKRWNQDKVPRFSAALAYYMLLSLPALLVVILTLAAWIYDRSMAKEALLAQVRAMIGVRAAEMVGQILKSVKVPKGNGIAMILGIAGLLLASSAVFAELQGALNTIWGVRPKPGRGILGVIKERVLAFLMVGLTGLLLIVLLLLSAGLAALDEFLSQVLPISVRLVRVGDQLLSFLIITVLFALVFRLVPEVRIAWRDVWVGALVTAALFTIGKFALGLYLGNTDLTGVYAAAGSLVLILIWFYYSAQIFFFGAEFTWVYAHRFGAQMVPAEGPVRVVGQSSPTEEPEKPEAGRERESARSGKSAPPAASPEGPATWASVSKPMETADKATLGCEKKRRRLWPYYAAGGLLLAAVAFRLLLRDGDLAGSMKGEL